jgi:hypothetical protein
MKKVIIVLSVLIISLTSVFSQVKSYYIQNVKTEKYLDVPNASQKNLVEIIQWDFVGGSNQRWQLVSTTEGYVFIKSESSGKYLEVPQDFNPQGLKIIQNEFDGGVRQQWKFMMNVDSSYCIISRATGKYLDMPYGIKDSGLKLIQFSGHEDENQRWNLKSLSKVVLEDKGKR